MKRLRWIFEIFPELITLRLLEIARNMKMALVKI